MDHEDTPKNTEVKFDPPLYIQRYDYVYDLLYKSNPPIKRVADFGCAEGNFLKHLKKLPFTNEISAVDISTSALESANLIAAPLAWDYLWPRNVKMNLSLYKGDVSEPDFRMTNLDALTLIELIEHLPAHTLEKLPANIFGYMKPNLVIITTPNSEFNVLFGQLRHGMFRHWDHKFEFTRQEFQNLAQQIVQAYPDYTVRFDGVGVPPEHAQHVGPCSQIAIFQRSTTHDIADHLLALNLTPYTLIDSHSFPERTKPEPKFEPFDWGIM